jgi:hypothetical protein
LIRLTLVAAAACAAAGCGNGRKPVFPVQGTVADADGKPIAGATVFFCPVENVLDNRHKPGGFSDTEGRFTLTTYDNGDGAPAGEYVVTVEWRVPGGDTPRKKAQPYPDRLKGKFCDPANSPLKATIVKGPNVVDLKLPTAINR